MQLPRKKKQKGHHANIAINADRVGSINIAQKYLGVFVGQKFPTNNTHVNGWSAMIAPEGEGAANFVSSEMKPIYKSKAFGETENGSSLDLFIGR
jgi:hypothetical protein